jgi:NitT/TauT family transport system ATP-binding protein
MSLPTLAPARAVSAPRGSAIRFRGVGKTFADGTEALAPFDLDVTPGEFVSIIGPSGCGKSTALRLASGLDTPTAGTIEVDRENLGYVFQDATLLPWRSVQRNAELLLELAGVDRAERAERARRALELTGLSGFARHKPRALSGGMRMRVSLARSLALEPHVFLFDEPFGALDEISRERLVDEIQALHRRERFTALFVTHSISEAVYLSTRVVVLSARPGRIVADIPVALDAPREPAIRYDPEFTRISGEVWDALRSAS